MGPAGCSYQFNTSKSLISGLFVAALSACGGDDGDEATQVPTNVPAAPAGGLKALD